MNQNHGKSRGKEGSQEVLNRHSYEWFSSRMTVICLALESRKVRDPNSILRIQFFLDDLERHYVDLDKDEKVQDAFRYLESYFRAYPEVRIEESRQAFERVKEIYRALGLRLEIEFHAVLDSGSKASSMVDPVGPSAGCVIS